MSDWTPVVGIVLGIPAIGFAVRMVVISIADGIARIKGGARAPLEAAQGEQARRMAQMEAELASLRDEVGRLSAVESFYAQLQTPSAPTASGGPTGPAEGSAGAA